MNKIKTHRYQIQSSIKNEITPRTGHFKKHPERENYTEKKREHELAFSATCPEEIMKVKKSKRSKSSKNTNQEIKFHHPKNNRNVSRSTLTKNRQCGKFKITTRPYLIMPSSLLKMFYRYLL